MARINSALATYDKQVLFFGEVAQSQQSAQAQRSSKTTPHHHQKQVATAAMSDFSQQYPHLTWWVENQGYFEIGADDYSQSLLRILDPGGMYFEYTASDSIDFALAAGEEFLEAELAERFLVKLNRETGEFEDK